MVLLRNPAYYGQLTGNVQRIELSLLPSAAWSAGLALYEADNLDILTLLPSQEMDRTRQRHAGDYVSTPYLALFYMGFNLSRPPFNDNRVRQAFVMATDREILANVALKGHGAPATGGFIPPGMPGHSPGISLPYDPDRARRLLAEAGYPEGRGFPPVDALTNADLTAVKAVNVTEYLQAQWQENLKVKIMWEAVAQKDYLERLYGGERPSIFFAGWRYDIPDPENFLGWCWYMTEGQLEAYSRMIAKAEQATDPGEQLKLFGQADRILVEAAAFTPLWYMRLHMLVKPWVSKFPTSTLKYWFWKDVIINPH